MVVEVRELSHCYVTMSFPDDKRYKVPSSILQVIRDACRELCPSADAKEYIVDPRKATHVYTKGVSPLSLSCVDYSIIKEAVVNGNSHELRSDESTIDVGSWLVQSLVLAICL